MGFMGGKEGSTFMEKRDLHLWKRGTQISGKEPKFTEKKSSKSMEKKNPSPWRRRIQIYGKEESNSMEKKNPNLWKRRVQIQFHGTQTHGKEEPKSNFMEHKPMKKKPKSLNVPRCVEERIQIHRKSPWISGGDEPKSLKNGNPFL